MTLVISYLLMLSAGQSFHLFSEISPLLCGRHVKSFKMIS